MNILNMNRKNSNEDAAKQVFMEKKLAVNEQPYQKSAITEEMYTQAKVYILKESNST